MEEIDLKELFDYFKGKLVWIIVSIILVVVVGNLYTIFTRVPLYKSNTSLVLVSEKRNDATSAYNNSEQQLNKNLVATYSEIIKSKTVLNKVIENLELDMAYADLKKMVTVEDVDNTEVIIINVSNSDADMAAAIANEIASVFVTESNEIYQLNNVSVLDVAEKSTVPYNINYLKDNAIYIMIGLVLSFGIIFVIYYFDTTIKTSDEIEDKLKLTVIGTVPVVGKE